MENNKKHTGLLERIKKLKMIQGMAIVMTVIMIIGLMGANIKKEIHEKAISQWIKNESQPSAFQKVMTDDNEAYTLNLWKDSKRCVYEVKAKKDIHMTIPTKNKGSNRQNSQSLGWEEVELTASHQMPGQIEIGSHDREAHNFEKIKITSYREGKIKSDIIECSAKI